MTRYACAIFVALMAIGCSGPAKPEANNSDSNKPSPEAPASSLKDLKRTVITPGSGTPIKKGDTVLVSYIGTLTNGKMFDSNMDKDYKLLEGKEPYPVIVGTGQVIKGWDEGLVTLLPGSINKLEIPYKMAYGEEGSGETIPPKSDLVFTVKIDKVYPAGEAPVVEANDVKKGSGPKVTMNSTVTFRYKGTTLSGRVFDDQSKLDITIPVSKLVPGFGEAMVGMMPGGKRKISWPPGSPNPTGYIPPNQPVEYVVDLIAVK